MINNSETNIKYSDSKFEPEIKTHPTTSPKKDLRSDIKSDLKSDPKIDTLTDVKPDSPVDSSSNSKVDQKIDPLTDPLIESNQDKKTDPLSDKILELKIESDSIPAPNTNTELPSETELQTNQKSQATDDIPSRSKKNEPKYKNIVFSGGSIKGICHIGVLKRLIDERLVDLKKLRAVAGTSAGSLLAVLVVLGFSIDEIWKFIFDIDMKKMVNPDFFMVLKKCGVDTGQIIYNLFEEIIAAQTGIKHINFKQLFEITKIHLIIVGSCLTTKEAVYFDHINTPNFKVSVAIRISISMPGFFTPVTIDGKKYVDGAVLDNYAMGLFKNELDETIGSLISDDYNTNYNYPEEYFLAILNLFLHHFYEKTALLYQQNTIYVKPSSSDVFIFNFDVNNKTKIDLFNTGYMAAHNFITKSKTQK